MKDLLLTLLWRPNPASNAVGQVELVSSEDQFANFTRILCR